MTDPAPVDPRPDATSSAEHEKRGFTLHPIGVVRSRLKDRKRAPRQGAEGAPAAWLEFEPSVRDGLRELAVGDTVLVLTWLHLADRRVLRVQPRSDGRRRQRGVFSTRSPDRPNPVGIHRVDIVEIDGPLRVRVRPLEAVDGTPVIDVKPVLDPGIER